MLVSKFMTRKVITATPETSLLQVCELIFKKNVHSLPIVDKDEKLVGIISKEDLLTKLYPTYGEIIPDFSMGEDFEDLKGKFEKLKNWNVEKIMNRRVIYTRPESNVMRALSRMIVRNVRQLPVLDDDERVMGMISKGDIFKGMFKQRTKKLTQNRNQK